VFRLLAPYFFTNSSKEVSKKVPPRHPGFYFKKQNKSAFFSPDFCGRCGTHESKSRFAQTAAADKIAGSNFKHALHGPKGGGQEPGIKLHKNHAFISLADGETSKSKDKKEKAKKKEKRKDKIIQLLMSF